MKLSPLRQPRRLGFSPGGRKVGRPIRQEFCCGGIPRQRQYLSTGPGRGNPYDVCKGRLSTVMLAMAFGLGAGKLFDSDFGANAKFTNSRPDRPGSTFAPDHLQMAWNHGSGLDRWAGNLLVRPVRRAYIYN